MKIWIPADENNWLSRQLIKNTLREGDLVRIPYEGEPTHVHGSRFRVENCNFEVQSIYRQGMCYECIYHQDVITQNPLKESLTVLHQPPAGTAENEAWQRIQQAVTEKRPVHQEDIEAVIAYIALIKPVDSDS